MELNLFQVQTRQLSIKDFQTGLDGLVLSVTFWVNPSVKICEMLEREFTKKALESSQNTWLINHVQTLHVRI